MRESVDIISLNVIINPNSEKSLERERIRYDKKKCNPKICLSDKVLPNYFKAERKSDRCTRCRNAGGFLTGNNSDSQLWTIVPGQKSTCRFRNKATNKFFDVIEGGTKNGCWLHQWEEANASTQIWEIESTGTAGAYKIKSIAAEKYLDIVGISSIAGANLQLWENTDGDNQEWELELMEDFTPKKAKKAKSTAPKAKKQHPNRKELLLSN